jgi:hypothetical protein
VLIRAANGTTRVIERTMTPQGAWLAPVMHGLDSWP